MVIVETVFLYPPSQDSVIQVTEQSFNSCSLEDPILYMNNGNSLFNITKPGDYFFTSGVKGNCDKSQKLRISVPGGTASSESSAAVPASAPSYPTVFGSIPMAPLSSPPSSSAVARPVAAVGMVICGLAFHWRSVM